MLPVFSVRDIAVNEGRRHLLQRLQDFITTNQDLGCQGQYTALQLLRSTYSGGPHLRNHCFFSTIVSLPRNTLNKCTIPFQNNYVVDIDVGHDISTSLRSFVRHLMRHYLRSLALVNEPYY